MGDGGLRFECLRKGQLGDVIILPDLTDFSVFGSKTDPTSVMVLPAAGRISKWTGREARDHILLGTPRQIWTVLGSHSSPSVAASSDV